MSVYLVSKVVLDSTPSPIAVCHTLAEADALVEKLSNEIPKGTLVWYSREAVEGGVVEPTPFHIKSTAAALAFCE